MVPSKRRPLHGHGSEMSYLVLRVSLQAAARTEKPIGPDFANAA